MQQIHTSDETVSKLKKAAKLRVRATPGIQHAQALDQVAQAAGYNHWKHVTECALNSAGSPLASLSARTCNPDRFPIQPQDFIIVSGETGSGKTMKAYDYALNALREGRTVRVADVGRSYEKLAQLVGGTLINVGTKEATTQSFGIAPLTVTDFEEVANNGGSPLAADHFPFNAVPGTGETWIIDEIELLPFFYNGLMGALYQHLATGGSVLLTTQRPPESDLAMAFAEIQTSANVRRAMVRLSRLRNPR